MKKSTTFVYFFFLALLVNSQFAISQKVVVSEYINASYNGGDKYSNEWTELLVVEDGVNMGNWILTDNNTDQNIRQGGVRFKNIPFWRNVRAGTIISLWHRDTSAGFFGNPPLPNYYDKDPSDGRLMLFMYDSEFFERVVWDGSAWKSDDADWLSRACNIAIGGDILQLFDAQGNSVHCLGHKNPLGSYWVSDASTRNSANKLNTFVANLFNGTSNRVFPGDDIVNYSGDAASNWSSRGTQTLTVSGGNDTRSLPNKNLAGTQSNYLFWHKVRAPIWNSPSAVATVGATDVSLRIVNKAQDANPLDGVQGYMIIRDKGTTPAIPVDGRTYTKGSKILDGEVIEIVSSSQDLITDNIVIPCGEIVTYRIFAFRYGTDNEFGNPSATNTARGRQYNTENYAVATAIKTSNGNKPVISSSGALQFCSGQKVTLTTPSTTESIQWIKDGVDIEAATTTSLEVTQAGSYQVTTKNASGCLSISDPITITIYPSATGVLSTKKLSLCPDENQTIFVSSSNANSFQWIKDGNPIPGATNSTLVVSGAGKYFVKLLSDKGCESIVSEVVVTQSAAKFSLSATSLDFGILGPCNPNSERSITVTNTGSEDITITKLNAPAEYTIVSPVLPIVLRVGSAPLVLKVSFSPASSKKYADVLELESLPCSQKVSINAVGEQQGSGNIILKGKQVVEFPKVLSCETNPGLLRTAIEFENTGAATVKLVGDPMGTGGSFKTGGGSGLDSIQANKTGIIFVEFQHLVQPVSTVKTFNFNFQVPGCSNTITIPITFVAKVVAPELDTDVKNVDLGVFNECTRPDTTFEVKIYNLSDTSIVVSSQPKIGADANDGEITIVEPTLPFTVPPRVDGGVITVKFKLVPTATKNAHNKIVNIVGDLCNVSTLFSLKASYESTKIDVTPVDSVVDFGTLSVCAIARKRTSKFIVSAIPDSKATIIKVDLPTGFSSPTLVQWQNQKTIHPIGDNQFEIELNPQGLAPGSLNEVLTVTFQPCGIVKTFQLKANITPDNISISDDKQSEIDFGQIEIGTVSSVQTITITNNSADAIEIGVPANVGGFVFVSSNPTLPTTLNRGQSVDVNLQFTQPTLSQQNVDIVFPIAHNSCSSQYIIRAKGIGYIAGSGNVPYSISIPDVQVKIGEDFSFSVYVSGDSLQYITQLQSLNIPVKFDSKLIKVSSVQVGSAFTNATTSFVVNNNVLSLKAENATSVRAGEAFIVQCKALLGNQSQTELSIDSTSTISTSTPPLKVKNLDNGIVTFQDVCPNRSFLIGFGEVLALSAKNTTDNIVVNFSVASSDVSRVTLYSLSGEKIATIEQDIQMPGRYSTSFPTFTLSQGTYVVEFNNGIRKEHCLVQVVK